MIKKIITLLTLIISGSIYGQSNKEIALQKGKEALRLEDEGGKFDEAIKLLEEAQKLDPDNIDFLYELAYAYTGKKEYDKSIAILEKLVNHKNANGRVYQSLGNAYDYQGNSTKAIEIYEKGIKRFPNSGELYLERGNMELGNKEYDKALSYYEKGIENDPKFASNYYWAAKLFCNSSERVWGIIYGELFMNIERNSKRTSEISKLLYDTYQKAIEITSDTKEKTTMNISFSTIGSQDNPLPSPKKGEKFTLPFGIGVYEPIIGLSLVDIKGIDLSSLNSIRERFLENYIKNGKLKEYPNVLYDYQNLIVKAGHFEAYNYWLLMKGNEEEFSRWKSENLAKFDNFLTWFKTNKLIVDLKSKFYRAQY